MKKAILASPPDSSPSDPYAEFFARGGKVTTCPTVYVLPVNGGEALPPLNRPEPEPRSMGAFGGIGIGRWKMTSGRKAKAEQQAAYFRSERARVFAEFLKDPTPEHVVAMAKERRCRSDSLYNLLRAALKESPYLEKGYSTIKDFFARKRKLEKEAA